MPLSVVSEEVLPVRVTVMQRVRTWLQGRVASGRRLRHVETLSLGAKRSVYLVECDGREFLVAAGGDGLSAPVLLDAARGVDRP